MKEFVLWGNTGVQLGTSSNVVNGGRTGSNVIIRSSGTITVNSHINSGGTINLANSNNVNGNITASNAAVPQATGTVFQMGSNASVTGTINVRGNVVIGGGSVTGPVVTTGTYSGPTPSGGLTQNGTPTLPILPTFPAPIVPSTYSTQQAAVTTTTTIQPGSYASLALGGSKTVTFNGPGDYVFGSILNSGNFNKLVFNFNGQSNRVFRIFVTGNVDLYKISVDYQQLTVNGLAPSTSDLASRILMQVGGNGTGSSSGYAWTISNGASGNNQSTWLGTVIALNGSINVGSGSSQAKIIGSLWSTKNVDIQSGVSVTYASLICVDPVAKAGPDVSIVCPATQTQLGTDSSNGTEYKWTAVVDGVTTVVGTQKTLTVTKAGTYTLSVRNDCGATVTDTVVVSYVSCVEPINETPNGKVFNIIGSELTNLASNIEEAKKYLIILGADDSVMIEAIAKVGKEKAARDTLWEYGIRDTVPNGISPLYITGVYPIAKLYLLNTAGAAEVLNHVRPVFAPLGNSGVVTSAGDTSVRAYVARNGFNVGGKGVKVGVISDSYNTLAGNPALIDVGNGDLPGTGNPDGDTSQVQVVLDYPYGRRTDEGRAMMQIVHDLAPKAPLAFRTGFISSGDMAYGILQLKDAGCKVIVDDVTYITEPFFKDGLVSTAISQVTTQGVTCFTSAGNFGSRSYTSTYNAVAPPGTFARSAHDFGGGDIYQHVRLKSGTYTIVLQWQDDIYSLGETATGTRNDLDIYLVDPGGRIGFNRNNLGGDPLEVMSFSINLPDTSQTLDADLMIVKGDSASGTPNPVFKYIIFRGNAVVDEYYSEQALNNKATIVGHANSADVVSVGAVLWSNTPPYGVSAPTVASFSSTGGTPIYNGGTVTVRQKPDLAAPNGVNTSTTVSMGPDNDGSGRADGYPNFYGTSAAAPHAAAVAALVLEAKKKFYGVDMTPAALKTTLFNSALTMQPDGIVSGANLKAGFGLVQPDSAIRTFASPTPHIDALVYDSTRITPGATTFTLQVTGEYLTGRSQLYFNDSALTTTVLNSSTLQASIGTFIGKPRIRAYNRSFGNGATGDGGFSNSLYFSTTKKDTVTIIADNKTKKYGEVLPKLTTTILYNGDTLEVYNRKHGTSITRQDLGVDSAHLVIRYTNSIVNALSDVGIYVIRASRPFDSSNPTDSSLLQKYQYDSTAGNLTITKLAVTVVPRDTTVVYGEPLSNFHFNYVFDSSASLANTGQLTNTIIASHQDHIDNSVVGVVNSNGGGDVVIFNGTIYPVFNNASVVIDGKLYPVLNGGGGSAVVVLNGHEYPVTNGGGGSAVVVLNGEEHPVVNGGGGSALVVLNGQLYPVLFNAAGEPYILFNGGTYPVTNGGGGSAVVVLNGQQYPVTNGGGGSAIVVLNGEYYAALNGLSDAGVIVINGQVYTLFNGGGGSAVVVLNGHTYPVLNGGGGSAIVVLNGHEYPVTNGSGGSAVVVLNGQEYPVTNGGGSAVVVLNGEVFPIVNGGGGSAVVVLNGQEYPVTNGGGGSAIVVLNSSGAELHPVTNGGGGSAVVVLNGQNIPVINGGGGSAVVVLNGQVYPVTNGGGGSAVVVLNGQTYPVTNGSGGSAVVVLNDGSSLPVVNSFSPSALINMNTMASSNAIANYRALNTTGQVTNVVDVSANSFAGFANNSSQTTLVNTLPLVNSRGLLNVNPIVNGGGSAIVVLNGTSIPVSNGSSAFVNSTTVGGTTNSRTAVIIDKADVATANSTSGTTVTMEGINVISGINAGVQKLIPATLLNPNFDISYKLGTVTITKAPITLKAKDTTKAYGDALVLNPTAFSITSGVMKYFEKLFLVNLTSTGTVATALPGNYPIVPSNAIGLYGTDPRNYNINYVNGALQVGTRNVTVKADAKTKVYGDTDPAFTYAITSGSLIGSDAFTGSLARASGENAGKYQINKGTLALNSNYSLTYVPDSLTITKALLTVTARDTSKIYGAANPTFTASYSGFKLSQTLSNSGVTGSPSLTTTATTSSLVGTYPITAAQGTLASSNYNFAFVNGTLSVNARTLTITATNKSKTYGQTVTFAGTEYTTGAGQLLSGDAVTGVTLTSAGADASAVAGTYPIVPSAAVGTGLSNYAISYVNGTLTVNKANATITVSGYSGIYDATAHGATGTAKGAFNEDLTSLLHLGNTYTIVPGGSANWTFDGNTNYNSASGSVSIAISKATPVVTATGGTFTYDGTAKSGSGTATGVNNTSLTPVALSYTGTSGSTTAPVNAGTYTVTASYAGSTNYNAATSSAATITINKATPVITWSNPADIMYGTALSSTQLNATTTISGTFAYSPASGTVLNAGQGQVLSVTFTPGSSNSANYTTATKSVTINVNKALLTVAADNKSKYYGDPNPQLTATITGFKLGQTLVTSGVTGTPDLSTTATQSSLPGTYPITVTQGTLTAANYTFKFVPGTLTVSYNPACLVTHSKFTSFGSTASSPTSLWLNIEIKVSGQLAMNGDYIMFDGGTLVFNNISTSVNNVHVERGMIIADVNTPSPTSYYDATNGLFITKVPPGFSSTSDIFISGAIMTSTTGFIKNNSPSTTLNGYFYSNVSLNDQWNYALAAYTPPTYLSDLSGQGSVVSINGTYKAGTPLPWLSKIVPGGSGNGGNNYTGSQSSSDNFTACQGASSGGIYIVVARIMDPVNVVIDNIPLEADLQVYPNPASSSATVKFVPSATGNSIITLYNINGSKVYELYNGTAEAGKLYSRKLNTQALAGGIYLIRLQENGKTVLKKLVVNK